MHQTRSTAETTFTISITLLSPPIASAGPDQQVVDTDNNGTESVILDGSASSDDVSIVSYVWKKGETELATGESPTVDLAVGAHTITLVVTDDAGLTASDEVVVTVKAPQPPVARAGTDQTVTALPNAETAEVSLNASASSDDGMIVQYVWHTQETELARVSNPVVQLAIRTHTVVLTVTDDEGLTASDTIVVMVVSDPSTDTEDPEKPTNVDTTRPVPLVTSTAADTVQDAFSVTISFSEAVIGFDLEDVDVTNGEAVSLQTTDSIAFTAQINPALPGDVSITVAADVAQDLAGNGNAQAEVFTVRYEDVIASIAEEVFRQSPIIYPVPAKQFVQISADLRQREAVRIQLTDSQGISYANKYLGETSTIRYQLNVNHLAAGLYLLQIQVGTITTTHKVVIAQ